MRKIFAFLAAALLASSPLAQLANAWTDTVFPDANDPLGARIGSSSWVSVLGIGCQRPCGGIYSKANLVDPRGYNLPMIEIRCYAQSAAPVKYYLQVDDNAWILDNEGKNVETPNRIELNVDGRDTLVLNRQLGPGGVDEFEAEISQDQLLRIRAARQVIFEMSKGSPGVAFPARGTALAIDTLILACADKELKALLWRSK